MGPWRTVMGGAIRCKHVLVLQARIKIIPSDVLSSRRTPPSHQGEQAGTTTAIMTHLGKSLEGSPYHESLGVSFRLGQKSQKSIETAHRDVGRHPRPAHKEECSSQMVCSWQRHKGTFGGEPGM